MKSKIKKLHSIFCVIILLKGVTMKKIIMCCVFLCGLNGIAYCQQASRIELIDGNVIEAEIISVEDGVYTLNADSLGKIKVMASKIKKIEMQNTNPSPQSTIPQQADVNAIKSQVGQIKARVANSPEIMQIITSLMSDPEFQEIMKDPEIVNAAKSEDINALMSNKKFMNLISHPKVREIENKLEE
jgi:hypothetical protein